MAEISDERIEDDVGSGMADVGIIVNRRSADEKMKRSSFGFYEFLFITGECVPDSHEVILRTSRIWRN